MNHKCKLTMVVLLILALLATPLLGCGKEAEKGKVTITIGMLWDLTGPISSACIDADRALHDLVKHINEEDPIPGVELKLVTYDTKYDPAREIPGYDWVTERGAEVIVAVLYSSAEILRPFAERDKIPIVSLSASTDLLESPGWTFCMQSPCAWGIKPVVEWIGDHWPNYPTKPKIGFMGTNHTFSVEVEEAAKEYCLANPDKFDWVVGCRAPLGVMSWPGEIMKLKDCDWIGIALDPVSMATFINELHLEQTNAKNFSQEYLFSSRGIIVDKAGYEAIDGSLVGGQMGWWSDPYPIVDTARELLYKYHSSGEAEKIIHAGHAYLGGTLQQSFFLQILREAIEEVGAENFDGQAFYNTAINFKSTYEGYEEWSFSETKRYPQEHTAIYEVRAEEEDIVRVSDWVPIEK